MDSGNSVSSSGGDEEYDDSRAAVAFNPPPIFPFANTLQMPSFNSPCPTTISNAKPTNHTFVPRQLQHVTAARVVENDNSNMTLMQQGSTEKQASARNPKKRTRASRRAPTTVLNTDTSNFRAMVQQFTGVPSIPFHDANININKRSSLSDLFGTTSNGRAYSSPYLLRPLASSSLTNNNDSLLSTVYNSVSSNVFDTDQEARKFISSNVFDTPNPIGMNSLVFQNNNSFPIGSSNDQVQSGSSSLFGNYMMIPTTSTQGAHYYNSLNDQQFGLLRHGNDHVSVNGLPNLVSSEQKDNQKNEGVDHDHNDNYKFMVDNGNGVVGGEATVTGRVINYF